MLKVISCVSGRSAIFTGHPGYRPLSAKIHWASGASCQKSDSRCFATSIPEMPSCSFTPEEYKGMSKARMIEIRKQNCNPMTMKVTYYKKPVFIHQGYMQYLWDVDGTRYLDLFAGVATVSVGHCHPKVTAAAEKQMRKLWHTTLIYAFPTLHEYCEKLVSHFPDPLKVVFLTNSGSEANDLAMFIARLHTGNFDIITFRGSYHGGSPMTMGLTSNAAYKYPVANGLGCTNTMCPDVFRGPWGGRHCRDSPVQTTRECSCAQGDCVANEQYIRQLKETLATSVPPRIAAFFAEPIQGVGGAVQYPKNYLKEAFKLVREIGGICIADETPIHLALITPSGILVELQPNFVTMGLYGEWHGCPRTALVQTGFGRTGSHFWGFQGHDVIPDMVTMAKGIGNGFPMGAVVTTPEIAACFAKGVHFNTFGGNPVACAIGSAVLDTIIEDGTQKNSLDVGTYLMMELSKLRDKYEVIGDVRGKGLQIGVEMVKDKTNRDPLPPQDMAEIFEEVKDMGVLIGKGGVYGQIFRIKPPMCITKEDADFFLAVFDQSVHNYMERR